MILIDSRGIGNAKTSYVVNRNPEKRLEPHEQMATAIVEIIKEKGGCLPQDLNAKDFSPKEVADMWAMAQTLAALMMEP